MTAEEIQTAIGSGKGHAIPYHFTTAEITAFVSKYSQTASLYPPLVDYLRTGRPAWGIIVNEPYGEILVWRDAARRLHVVDVTNMRIVQSVKAAAFESPDAGLLQNLMQDFGVVFSYTADLVKWLSLAAMAVAMVYVVTQWKK